MKAKSIIIAAVLALQINILLADNNSSAPVTIETNSFNAMSLAPTTPMEAIFEEPVAINDFADLAPVMSTEASFDDAVEPFVIDNVTLAPVTPAEASFE